MNAPDPVIQYFPQGSLPLKTDIPGASFWAVALRHAMLTYFEVAPGVHFPHHHHPSEQITLVLEGILVFSLADREVSVQAGEVIAIPGEVPHAVTAGPDGAKAVDAWSPVRTDYETSST